MTFLINIFNRLFNRKTIDDVVASFNKTVTNLEALVKTHVASAEQHAKEVEVALQNKLKHEADAIRASAIAQKIRELIA